MCLKHGQALGLHPADQQKLIYINNMIGNNNRDTNQKSKFR